MKKLDEIRAKRELIIKIAKKYGLTDVCIFGSVARGTEDADSDIDILVTSNSETTLFDLGGFYSELETIFGSKLSVLSRGSLFGRIKKEILKDAVPI